MYPPSGDSSGGQWSSQPGNPGQPGHPQENQPSSPAYGAPAQGGYGAPAQGGYGAPAQGGHPAQPGQPPVVEQPKKKSKLPLILGIAGAVVVLVCGGCFGISKFGGDSLKDAAESLASAVPTPSPTPTDVQEVDGNLESFNTGDCLTEDGPNKDKIHHASCTDKGAFKVLLRKEGTTDESQCPEEYDHTLYIGELGKPSKDDLLLCVGPVS